MRRRWTRNSSQRFLREARLASALSHPNIAQIFEIGDAGEVSFIAMEYVEGETLRDRVAHGPLSAGDVIDIALQLFDALEEAHGKGIMHRDLKSANVMLTSRGRVKVLDFGLAKRVGAERSRRSHTRQHGRRRHRRHRPLHESGAGAWSHGGRALGHLLLGRVMYELLTGRLPFAGGSVAETLYRIVHSQPEPIAGLNPRVPPLLERIVMKALDKQVEQRYQHAREVLADLRSVTPAIETTRPRTAAAKRTSKSIDSLAVLPLQAMTAAADMDYLADGITESLINALSQIPRAQGAGA